MLNNNVSLVVIVFIFFMNIILFPSPNILMRLISKLLLQIYMNSLRTGENQTISRIRNWSVARMECPGCGFQSWCGLTETSQPPHCHPLPKSFFFFSIIYLTAQGLSCSMRDLCCCVWDLRCGVRDPLVAACMRDLVPWPGIKPGPPALGAWSLNH